MVGWLGEEKEKSQHPLREQPTLKFGVARASEFLRHLPLSFSPP